MAAVQAATMVNLAKCRRRSHRLPGECDLEGAVLLGSMNNEKICHDRFLSNASYVVKKWVCALAYVLFISVFFSLDLLRNMYFDEYLSINRMYNPIISFFFVYFEWLISSIAFYIVVNRNNSSLFYDLEKIHKHAQTMKNSSKFALSALAASLSFSAFLYIFSHDDAGSDKAKSFMILFLLMGCICFAWIIEIIRAQWALRRAFASEKPGG